MLALTYFEYKELEALESELSAQIERTPRPRPLQPQTLGDALDCIRWALEGTGSLVRGSFPTSLDAHLTVVGERSHRLALRLGAIPIPELQREAQVVLALNLRCSPESDLACVRERFLAAREAFARALPWVNAVRFPAPAVQAEEAEVVAPSEARRVGRRERFSRNAKLAALEARAQGKDAEIQTKILTGRSVADSKVRRNLSNTLKYFASQYPKDVLDHFVDRPEIVEALRSDPLVAQALNSITPAEE